MYAWIHLFCYHHVRPPHVFLSIVFRSGVAKGQGGLQRSALRSRSCRGMVSAASEHWILLFGAVEASKQLFLWFWQMRDGLESKCHWKEFSQPCMEIARPHQEKKTCYMRPTGCAKTNLQLGKTAMALDHFQQMGLRCRRYVIVYRFLVNQVNRYLDVIIFWRSKLIKRYVSPWLQQPARDCFRLDRELPEGADVVRQLMEQDSQILQVCLFLICVISTKSVHFCEKRCFFSGVGITWRCLADSTNRFLGLAPHLVRFFIWFWEIFRRMLRAWAPRNTGSCHTWTGRSWGN